MQTEKFKSQLNSENILKLYPSLFYKNRFKMLFGDKMKVISPYGINTFDIPI